MNNSNKNQLVTIADLEAFKVEIIASLKDVFKNMPNRKPRKWLKSAEVRKLIGVSPGKLQTIRESGLLSFTKIGGNIYYDQEDIIKLFEQNKINKKDFGK